MTGDLLQHLTNCSVSAKHSDSTTDTYKATLASVIDKIVENAGYSTEELWRRFSFIISNVCKYYVPFLRYARNSLSCPPGARFFQIIGVDVLMDTNRGGLHLMEINHNPSMSLDGPMDLEIKPHVVAGALAISCIRCLMNYR